MAQRRSRNRRSSSRKLGVSGFLDDDTNVYEGNDPLWFDRTVIRPSTSIVLTRNDSSILNPDSTVDVSKLSPNWHKNLSQSNSSKLMEQAVQKNISERLNNEQSDSSRVDPTTESESEHESQKRRANFRAHQAKSNKSEKSNIFLKALEETTESHTRNLKNYTTAQESESEHEYEKKRTRFRTQQKKGDKSERSNIFLRALEETTDSHTRTLTIQKFKDHESESTHDESTSSRRLRPKLFQTPNSPARRLTTGKTSNINENKSIHNESTSSRKFRSILCQPPNDKVEVFQIQSNRNSLQKSVSKSVNESKLAKTLNNKSANREKSNAVTDDQNEIERADSSEIFEGNRSQLNDQSDEENIYDGSFNRNETSKNESEGKSLKRKLGSSQSRKLSVNESKLAKTLNNKSADREKSNAVTDDQNEIERSDSSEIFEGNRSQLNNDSDEENIYDVSFNRNEMSKTKSQNKSQMAEEIDNNSQTDPDFELSHNLRKKNSSNIVNASHKNVSTKRTSTINEVQDTSKTVERNSLHKTVNDSKSLSKSRKSQSQNISEANNSTALHNSDEENSTMPRYIRRTQSRLFKKNQRIDNEEIRDYINHESSRVKNNKTQESLKIHEKNSLANASNASQNSPSLRKRQSQITSTPNVIETRESDEENSTIPKYIRRTKSRLFQKSQTANNENVFDEVLNANRLSKNSGVEASQNSKQTSKSMLRDAMNWSTSLMKPRVVLTRVQNPDSSTESQKENRLAISRAKNSPSKSKRQITTVEGSKNDENSPSKSKQQKLAIIEDSRGNVTHSKNSPRKSRNQTVSLVENQNVSHVENSPRKSRMQKVSVKENRNNASPSKSSQNKLKQQAVIEEDNEADASHGRNSLRKSKHQATIEASDNHPEHTVSLPEESNGQGGSKEDSARKNVATANERSRSNSHSSVETSSDRTPQQMQEQGAPLSDSSALPSDELLHTPNPAQSTLKLSGKPLRRLTQFSFRGWEQESIIAPIAPQPALAAAMRTATIDEEPAEAPPQHPAETVSRHPPVTFTPSAAEAPSRHAAKVSPRHSAEASSRHAAKVSPRHSAEASSRHAAKVSPRHSAEASSRHSVQTSPQNAAEIPSPHSVEASSQHSTEASIRNAAEASSRHPAEAAVEAVAHDEDDDVDVINDSDASDVSDYPLLTRHLNEIPYENERTTDNEEPAPSINANTLADNEQIDQNVSTIEKSAWVEALKKTDALKLMMEAQMKRERERRQQEERQKQQRAAKLKRIMVQKAAEKRKREKKPVDKAFLVDGKVYKQPKLPRPQKWATDRLYKHLWKCMESRYGLRTRVKSEEFILKLANFAKIFERRKKFENYEGELEDLLHIMAKLNIITTRYDFYRFCWEFMPYSFRLKVRPMMMPGNVRNIPYNPELTNKPILPSNDISSSESESELNQTGNQPDSGSE